MNQYVTGTVIKELREKNKMTQLQVAQHRMFKTKEDAEASIPKEKSKKTRSPYDYM